MDIYESELANIYELIKKYFRLDHSDVIYHEVKKQYFGTWVVILKLNECRMKIYSERGEIFMAFGPLDTDPGWRGGPWVDAEVLIAYTTEFKVIVGKYQGEKRETEEQIKRLADFFKQFYEKINNLFSNNGFEKHQSNLDLAHQKIIERYIHDALNQ